MKIMLFPGSNENKFPDQNSWVVGPLKMHIFAKLLAAKAGWILITTQSLKVICKKHNAPDSIVECIRNFPNINPQPESIIWQVVLKATRHKRSFSLENW